MKLKKYFAIVIACICFTISYSCNNSPKTPKIKNNVTSHPHEAPPPPQPNRLIAMDSMTFKIDNKVDFFRVKLTADKTVDIKGEALQIYRLEAHNNYSSNGLDFALPPEYNYYWNDLTISKDTITKIFNIGFQGSDTFHILYSALLDSLPFNKGLILIRAN